MRPVNRSCRMAMFHRIDMHIIDMRLQVACVTNGVLPESPLPQIIFTAGVLFQAHALAQQMSGKRALISRSRCAYPESSGGIVHTACQ